MSTDVTAAPLVRPMARRLRLWVALAAAVVVGAVLVGTLSDKPGRPLDPGSAHHNGSKALVRLLARYGVAVTATNRVSAAVQRAPRSAVVVTAPDEYSDQQLRELAAATERLVLVRPGSRAARAIAPGLEPAPSSVPFEYPFCSDPGASAAGRVTLPGDTSAYQPGQTGAAICYGGAVLTTPRLAVLGSASLLENGQLGDRGVAALDVNAITDSRRIASVVWLLPGTDTAGPGATSIWDLFPAGTYRVFWWLLGVGVLTAVWRARRLGGVVTEPLPVVVRSAEVVEGHGRLYQRAGARDRAAAALRTAVTHRLGHRLGLPKGADGQQVGLAVAGLVARPPAEVVELLAGRPPVDDAGLLRLAHELDTLEAAVGGSTEGTT